MNEQEQPFCEYIAEIQAFLNTRKTEAGYKQFSQNLLEIKQVFGTEISREYLLNLYDKSKKKFCDLWHNLKARCNLTIEQRFRYGKEIRNCKGNLYYCHYRKPYSFIKINIEPDLR